jgi:uncharacterized membrane protein YkvA (DUF1232 family)
MKTIWPFKTKPSEPQGDGAHPHHSVDESQIHKVLHHLAKHAAKVPFAKELLSAYYCALDRRTPMQVRAILAGALAYFVMPVDAIPDVLAVIGFTDDMGVLMTALITVRRHILPRHEDAANALLERLRHEDGVQAPSHQS